MKPVILSTKVLNKEATSIVNSAGFDLLQHDFITTENCQVQLERWVRDFESSREKNSVLILTSPKALSETVLSRLQYFQEVWLVGDRLEKSISGKCASYFKADSSNELLSKISLKAETQYYYLCSEIRHDTLSNHFKKSKVDLKEFYVYKTKSSPKKMTSKIDALLFFSPSAVKSYELENSIGNERLFAIGLTTRSALKQHSNVLIPERPTQIHLAQICVNTLSESSYVK